METVCETSNDSTTLRNRQLTTAALRTFSRGIRNGVMFTFHDLARTRSNDKLNDQHNSSKHPY